MTTEQYIFWIVSALIFAPFIIGFIWVMIVIYLEIIGGIYEAIRGR